MRRKRIYGGIIDCNSLRMLEEKRDLFYLISFIVHNTKPVGHQVAFVSMSSVRIHYLVNCTSNSTSSMLVLVFLQDLVGLVISTLLLGDFSLVLLTLLQLYSISLAGVFLVLFILPLGILMPFPAGINALFSHGPRRSAGLARIYALWIVTSLINVVSCHIYQLGQTFILSSYEQPNIMFAASYSVAEHVLCFSSSMKGINPLTFPLILCQVVAFICGYIHYNSQSSSSKKFPFQTWSISM